MAVSASVCRSPSAGEDEEPTSKRSACPSYGQSKAEVAAARLSVLNGDAMSGEQTTSADHPPPSPTSAIADLPTFYFWIRPDRRPQTDKEYRNACLALNEMVVPGIQDWMTVRRAIN